MINVWVWSLCTYIPPSQVTAQNFMPICNSCQAVCVTIHFRSDVQLRVMHLICYIAFVKQDEYVWSVLKRRLKIYPLDIVLWCVKCIKGVLKENFQRRLFRCVAFYLLDCICVGKTSQIHVVLCKRGDRKFILS